MTFKGRNQVKKQVGQKNKVNSYQYIITSKRENNFQHTWVIFLQEQIGISLPSLYSIDPVHTCQPLSLKVTPATALIS